MTKLIQKLIFITVMYLSLTACASKKPIPLYEQTELGDEQSNQSILLVVPIQLDLIYHNGVDQDFSLPYQAFVNYRILPGKHLIGFQYLDLHTNDEGTEEVISSKPVLIRFNAKSGKTYQVVFNNPDTYEAAIALETNPLKIKLMQNKHLITVSVPFTKKLEYMNYFTKNSPMTDNDSLDKLSSANRDFSAILENNEKDPVQQLQFWWKQATVKERGIFNEWAIQH